MNTISLSRKTFTKAERLRSRMLIGNLFSKGDSVVEYPIRLVWRITPVDSPYPAQMAVSVSKRRLRKAVDRNLVKRRMRECYRHNKAGLYHYLAENNMQITLLIIYLGAQIPPYDYLCEKQNVAIEKMMDKMR